MSATRILAGGMFLAILAGTFAMSKPSDVDVLCRIGTTSLDEVRSALPDNGKLAAPLAAFRAGDALPIEERVRVRIQTDKDLTGSEVTVAPTNTAGQVKLKGVVSNVSQKQRAVELAERTAGVTSVIEELAIPTP
jgi:hypothetical protein